MNFEALFLGPQSENYRYFKEILDLLVNEHLFWRRNFHPEDLPCITFEDQQKKDFLATIQKTKEILLKLSARLKNSSIPWCSPRYLGHMTSDVLMPALLAYIATILYNPNNVAYEGSPATTALEIEVGKDLAELIGFDKEKAWGHITSGGTVANYEGLWVARNLKYFPFALRDIAKKYNFNLNLTYKNQTVDINQLDDFGLLNLNSREILNAMENLLEGLSQQGNNRNKIIDEIRETSLRAKGLRGIDFNLGCVLIPQTRHYSWDKAMDVLGLGTENLKRIPVDKYYRLDISKLEEKIKELAQNKIPILAVVGVVGSTEEGAVDQIHKIIDLRTHMEEEGISFYIHVDAAYGGYAKSVFIDNNGNFIDFDELLHILNKEKIIAKGIWPNHEIYEAYKALAEVESVTIDPHKLGYVPYQAGAVVFADKRIRNLISYFAPYVFEKKDWEKNPTLLGSFIMEGSKSGASVSAVWAAHRACPLNISGYGKLIGESIEGAQLLYEKINNLQFQVSHKGKKFKVIAKALTKPDLNILVYAFNIENNKSLAKMNKLNERLKQKLSYAENHPILAYDFIVSKTELSYHEYGDIPVDFIKKLKIDQKEWFNLEPEERKVVVIRSCIMSPYLTKDYTDEDYVSKFIEVIKSKLQELINEDGVQSYCC